MWNDKSLPLEQQVQLVDNTMTVLVLVVSWQSRVIMRQINMQKYTWYGEELNTGLYQSDDSANSHLPKCIVRQNEHYFLPFRGSFSGSLTFLFFLGPITSSWLKARFRRFICKNHQKEGSFSQGMLLQT